MDTRQRLRFRVRRVTPALLLLCVFVGPSFAQRQNKTTVGMPGQINQLILPGTELEVMPRDRKDPVVVRITEAFRHGASFRYDLSYYGMEPGEFDLKKYLRRKDGGSTADIPSIPVVITPTLPPGQVLPTQPEPRGSPSLGGYRVLLVVLGLLWVAGLVLILFLGRRRKHAAEQVRRKLTFADRLRPLVEQAAAGTLSREDRATLERMLITYWKHRLRLEDERPDQAFAVLRGHEQAGPLIRQLEAWLHQRSPDRNVDVSAMLAPYQNLPVEAGAAK